MSCRWWSGAKTKMIASRNIRKVRVSGLAWSVRRALLLAVPICGASMPLSLGAPDAGVPTRSRPHSRASSRVLRARSRPGSRFCSPEVVLKLWFGEGRARWLDGQKAQNGWRSPYSSERSRRVQAATPDQALRHTQRYPYMSMTRWGQTFPVPPSRSWVARSPASRPSRTRLVLL